MKSINITVSNTISFIRPSIQSYTKSKVDYNTYNMIDLAIYGAIGSGFMFVIRDKLKDKFNSVSN